MARPPRYDTSALLDAAVGLAAAAGPAAVTPMAAFVEDIGGKQVVGYYLAQDEACAVTMMIAEVPGEAAAPTTAARVSFALPPTARATVESALGGRLALTCGADAGTLVVDSRPAARQLASR